MKLSAHIIAQHWGGQDDDWVKRLQPKSIKMVDFFDRVPRMHELSPQSLIVLRDWAKSEQKDDVRRDPFNTGERHANEWAEKLQRWNWSIPKEQIVVVGINEPPVWEDPKPWVDYTVAFLYRLQDYGIRGGALNLSVGWPANTGPDTPPDWTPYEPVRKAIVRGQHFLFIHEYFDHRGPQHMWGWWAGRYTQCPWDVPIIIGECGLDQYVSNPNVSAHARGWQGQVNAETYWNQLMWYERKLQEDKRIHSAQIFSWDYNSPWQSFDVRPVLDKMPTNDDFNHVYLPQVGTSTPPVTPPADPPTNKQPLLWPVPESTRITQHFVGNESNYPNSSVGHMGIDLGTPLGTPVWSPADGIVQWVDFDSGYGNYIRIYHAAYGFHSFFAHLRELPTLKKGDVVKRGVVVGHTGNTGFSTGAHLHFEARLANKHGGYVTTNVNGKGQVDPLLFHRWVNR